MKKIKFILYIFCFALLFFNNLEAENSDQVDKITKNLRCLICQGQSVYDSQSDFALSMKILIQKKINEGKNENEIYDFLKNQYGQWISYDPEFNKKTFILWILPILLFVIGGAIILRKFIVQKL